MNSQTMTIDLSAGSIEYTDTARAGPVVVLFHVPSLDSSPWRDVMDELAPQYR